MFDPWAPLSRFRILSCCGVGVAVPPIRPLAWEPPYVAGETLKGKNKQTNKNKPTALVIANDLLLLPHI